MSLRPPLLSRAPTVVHAVAWACLALCGPGQAWAQTVAPQAVADQGGDQSADPSGDQGVEQDLKPNAVQNTAPVAAPGAGLSLKPSALLAEQAPAGVVLQELPSFVSGQHIDGEVDGRTVVEGEAELRRHGLVIRADRLVHNAATQEAEAEGHVLINRSGNRYQGPSLRLNLETSQGHFESPSFSLLGAGEGDASRVDFVDAQNSVVHNGRYSTCPRPGSGPWTPDWEVRARRIELDNEAEQGLALGGVLAFKGVPLLAAPYLSFPLSDKRKSGVLPPTLSGDNISGIELTLPYYLNLAPHFDATLYPTLMTERGVDLGAEFRYLQPNYSGTLRGAFMPSDRLRDRDRWAYGLQHQQRLNLRPLGSPFDLRMNLNRVSDDDYWRDFPRSSTSLSARLLPSELELNWAKGPWAVSAGAYRWQTLQDPDSIITPPFDRLPSIELRHLLRNTAWGGLDTSLQLAHTRFRSDTALTGQPSASRSLFVGGLSRRWETPGWYLQPNARLHSSVYQLPSGTIQRHVPTLSLDSGLLFERQTSFGGRGFTQTLEPRLFGTWTPFREQSQLPNYDSALNDFSLSSIFSEHAFGGHDRISDTRAITLGVTSRLLDPDSGAEVVRLGLAQRYLLDDQNVVLPGCAGQPGCDAETRQRSDVLMSAAVQWSPSWLFDATVQYSPERSESVRTTLSGRYTPSNYRVLSAAYRLQRDSSEQIELGWQWPLNDLWATPSPDRGVGRGLGDGHWYGVGRLNYSMLESKLVDVIAGFEYDAGCWIGRLVLEQLQRGSAKTNRRVLVQLEFSGFTRIGSSPLQTLRENVPRYQFLRQDINPPSRFQNHD